MGSSPLITMIDIKSLTKAAGAVACGVAEAGMVDIDGYRRWVAQGRHAGMGYLEKYDDVRADPRLLLPGARSIVAAAFSYYCPETQGDLRWARYALGDDYHEVLRRRLTPVAEAIEAEGYQARICVDTAPLRERYWAQRAGIGFKGRNGLLIVPGAGTWCLLGFIVTTMPLEPDQPMERQCDGCGRCIAACPGHALDGTGMLDARRCRSYLTIESRDDTVPKLGKRVYGCDICQEVCPHNQNVTLTTIPEFMPRPEILALTKGDILEMDQARFSAIFSHSPIKRAKLTGLQRNARGLEDE